MHPNNEQLELFPKDRTNIIYDSLKRYALPDHSILKIKALLEGKIDESSLVCCNSGCEICSEVLFNCLQSIKKELNKNG